MNDDIQKFKFRDLQKESSIIRFDKDESFDVVVSPKQASYIDTDIICSKFYNSFNYSKLPDACKTLNLTLGITSAKQGEGKTLVSSNMAVSFALGYRCSTVIVDLNYKNPRQHEIFGVEQVPGLTKAIEKQEIVLHQSKIDQLFVLPTGDNSNFNLQLNDIISVRKVIQALESRFDFVIVDMSSVLPIEDFPILFANEVDGLLAVLDTQKTCRSDIEEMFNHLNRNQVLGFIMNKYQNQTN